MEYPWVVTGILGFWGVVPTQSILDFKECWQDTGHQLSVAKNCCLGGFSVAQIGFMESWGIHESNAAVLNNKTAEEPGVLFPFFWSSKLHIWKLSCHFIRLQLSVQLLLHATSHTIFGSWMTRKWVNHQVPTTEGSRNLSESIFPSQVGKQQWIPFLPWFFPNVKKNNQNWICFLFQHIYVKFQPNENHTHTKVISTKNLAAAWQALAQNDGVSTFCFWEFFPNGSVPPKQGRLSPGVQGRTVPIQRVEFQKVHVFWGVEKSHEFWTMVQFHWIPVSIRYRHFWPTKSPGKKKESQVANQKHRKIQSLIIPHFNLFTQPIQ